jgi:hypothetical protein
MVDLIRFNKFLDFFNNKTEYYLMKIEFGSLLFI